MADWKVDEVGDSGMMRLGRRGGGPGRLDAVAGNSPETVAALAGGGGRAGDGGTGTVRSSLLLEFAALAAAGAGALAAVVLLSLDAPPAALGAEEVELALLALDN